MKKILRLTSVITLWALLLCILASCNLISKDPAEVISAAEEALASTPYKMELGIQLTSEDEGMKETIEKLSSPTLTLVVDGESFMASSSYRLNGRLLSSKYTAIDGVIYYEGYEENTEKTEFVKEKTTLTDEVKDRILNRFRGVSYLDPDSFGKVSATGFGKECVITCTEIKDEALKNVEDVLSGSLSHLSAVVGVKDASLLLQVSDGKYQGAVFTCTYVVTTDSDVYTVVMTAGALYEYNTGATVVSPADAANYKEVPII